MLQHSNIVITYDLDRDGDTYYLAMAFLEGMDLGKYVREFGPLPVDKASNIIRQVCEGLAHAHSYQVVHRDIKPNNVMLTPTGNAVVLDMGLAKIRDESVQDHLGLVLSSTSRPLGTPQYMFPEQFTDSRTVDIRSDIYSLGCTFYYLLTGNHPFESNDYFQLEKLHLESWPAPITQSQPNVPAEIIRIIDRMIAKQPRDRYQQPDEIASDLRRWTTGTSLSAPPEPASPVEPRKAFSDVPTLSHRPTEPTTVFYHLRDFSIEMVRIPAGSFLAGCSAGMADRAMAGLAINNIESAKRTLMRNVYERRHVEQFDIARYAITRAQYECFLAASGRPRPSGWPQGKLGDDDKQKPVTDVSLDDAMAFCAWANLRLPTGDEWEKVARGTDGRAYPWGNDFDCSLCNCSEAGADGVVNVDRFASSESPYGVRQAVGNVWEWVMTPGEPPTVRGGSYESSCQVYGAVFTTIPADAEVQRPNIGFRVARQESVGPRTKRSLTVDDVRRALELDLVRVPSGVFIRGLSVAMVADLVERFGLSKRDVETLVGEGVKSVYVPSFRIAKQCVTNEQFLTFVRVTGHAPPAGWERGLASRTFEPSPTWLRLPVTNVSQEDALTFCRWAGHRLPSNDEWEKASRGEDGRRYPWGDVFEVHYCNTAESERKQPITVDSLEEGCSPYGLYHAAGNVFEWVSDVVDGLSTVRGGSFDHTGAVYGLVGYKMRAEPSLALDSFGFRVGHS